MSKCDLITKIETDFKSLKSKMEGSLVASAELQKDEFSIRLQSIVAWFQYCSFKCKLDFLFKLLYNINNKLSLKKILICFNSAIGKDHTYSGSMSVNNFANDKMLNDHNRTLTRDVLESVMLNTIEWFTSLKDPEQVEVMIELLQLAEGSIIRIIYPFIKKEFENWVPRDKILPQINFESIPELSKILPELTDTSKKTNRLTFFLESGIDLVPLQERPEDPLVIDILRKREHWSKTISDYKMYIDSLIPKEKVVKDKNEKKGKSKKLDKKGRDIKSGKKKNKSASKGKKKGSKLKMDEFDQMQLLPIWVGKKILNYLDQKNLLTLKEVNAYWEYLIDGILEDRTVRKLIDKQILRSEHILEGQNIAPMKPPVKTQELTITEKKLMKLDERRCINTKAHLSKYSEGHTHCLLFNANENEYEQCQFPVRRYDIFPRTTAIDLKNYPEQQIEIAIVASDEDSVNSGSIDI